MSYQKVAGRIAKREGKKVQVSIGNIREVLRVLRDICAEERAEFGISETMTEFHEAVFKRVDAIKAKRKK
jgi:hypothetical protein